jgi:hypothetical protein
MKITIFFLAVTAAGLTAHGTGQQDNETMGADSAEHMLRYIMTPDHAGVIQEHRAPGHPALPPGHPPLQEQVQPATPAEQPKTYWV